MSQQPLVSVCINCFNAENCIVKTVRSVLTQTYTNLQVIVVDDHSTDNTMQLLESIKDDRLEVYRLDENGHISNANNEALSHVKGEFVAHLDADDVWYADKIEKQLTFLQTHPEYGACFSLAEMVDIDGNVIEDHRFRAENGSQEEIFAKFMTTGNYLCHSSMFAAKEILDRIGGHDLTLLYFHDFELWLRMIQECAVYILPEKLLAYRVSDGSNSDMIEEKHAAHVNEFAQIAYQTILSCEDGFFLRAFADRLRLQGEHTPEQTALEKAFLLLSMIPYYPQNPALGLRYLAELMAIKKYRDVAKSDFGFTVKDLYTLQRASVYHDGESARISKDTITHLNNINSMLQARFDETTVTLQTTAAELDTVKQELEAHRQALAAEQQAHAAAQANYEDAVRCHEEAVRQLRMMSSSKSWKLTAPLRMLNVWRQMRRCSKHPKTKDGKDAVAVVVMYGFFAHNLGDDLFFDILFKRYPDTVFVAYDAMEYEAFFARYPNVYCYTKADPRVSKIDRVGAKLGKKDYFEKLLIHYADAVVHIGGSIYQQIGTWEEDLKIRKKRYKRSRPFFSISSNFGPHQTKSYEKTWRKRFKKCRDVCFRDDYSAVTFNKVKAVRYAPDLLFSYPLPEKETIEGRLLISVIHPGYPGRPFPEYHANEYRKTLALLTEQWLKDGKTVCFAGFCDYQSDDAIINEIIAMVPEELRGGISTVRYTKHSNGFDEILSAIAESEYIIATRFHAMVFRMAAGKKLIPLCYKQKMHLVLDDICFNERILDMEAVCDMEIRVLNEWIMQIKPFDVEEQKARAHEQFLRLDEYIAKKGGTVVKSLYNDNGGTVRKKLHADEEKKED